MSSEDKFDAEKFGEDLRNRIRQNVHDRMPMGVRANRPMGSGGLWPGAILVIIGTVILLSHMGVISGDLWRFWPGILVTLGVIRFADRCNQGVSVVLILVGSLLLLNNLGVLRLTWGELWPLVLIAVGVVMIWGRMSMPRLPSMENQNASGPNTSGGPTTVQAATMFGGVERRITMNNFTGGTVSATFGGVDLDFRAADMEGDEAVLYLEALFGGINIVIPERWMAIYEGQSMFGGFSDETRPPLPEVPGAPARKRLILRGQAVFGGITVKN